MSESDAADWNTLVENHTAPVRYPFMRRYMIEFLESLSSLEYQQQVWLDPKQFDCFDEAVHCLFDDLGLADECLAQNNVDGIGIIFWNQAEAYAVSRLVRVLDTLIGDPDVAPADLDQEYMASSRWPEVIQLAIEALHLIQQNDLKHSVAAVKENGLPFESSGSIRPLSGDLVLYKIPHDWNPVELADGWLWQDPNQPDNSVRFYRGELTSDIPEKQEPYVIVIRDGQIV